jgi:hypothetical protein
MSLIFSTDFVWQEGLSFTVLWFIFNLKKSEIVINGMFKENRTVIFDKEQERQD